MPDVFLSYSREDKAVASRFAEGLRREGFDVWWDQSLQAGEAFDDVTERALADAGAVLVLWSKSSVNSRWVRAEATQAEHAHKLVPVMIEPCKRPIMFELTHTADLSHWKGEVEDADWRSLVSGLRRITRREAASDLSTAFPAGAARRLRAGPFTWIALAAVLVAIGAGAWLWKRPGAQPVASAPDAPATAAACTAVAVMPFANLTGDASKDYLGDGMAEELINLLAKVRGMTVTSRTSSFAYKGRNTDLKQIARDLDVCSILEGSVRSAGETLRVTAQLIDARVDKHIWSQTYDRQFTDLFKLQDDLAHEIVSAFRKTMSANLPEFQSSGPPTQDLEAYDLYLRAVASLDRGTDAGSRDAVPLLEAALERDPRFARAWQTLFVAKSTQSSVPLAEVEADARRANTYVPGLLGAGWASLEARRGNLAAAEALYRKILPTATNEPGSHNGHAIAVLWPTGQLDRAIEGIQEANRLSPASVTFIANLARAYSAQGRDEQAVKLAAIATSLGYDPSGRRIVTIHADADRRAGRYAESAGRYNVLLSESLRKAGAEEQLREVFVAMGEQAPARRKAAIESLKELRSRLVAADWPIRVFTIGWFAQLGDLDAAFESAGQLRDQFKREGQSPTAAWSWLWTPELRQFRRDSRFQSLAHSIGLMEYWDQYGPPDGCDLTDGKLSCH